MKDMTKEEIRTNVKNNLIELRKKKKMTQSQLASLFEKSDNAIASWEQGISLPDIPTLYKLSIIYDVTMEYFVADHSRKDDE